MARGQKSKEQLNSRARLSKIKVFIPQSVSFNQADNSTVARFSRYTYWDSSCDSGMVEEGVIQNFPIIFRNNGEPWDLGNLYLMWKFNEIAKIEPPVVDTLWSIAKHLTMYLRWIEHNQTEPNDLHELHFPDRAQERVTYRYHRYLKRLLRQRPQVIKIGVAKARMAAVVNFYRGIIKGGLVSDSDILNPPYEPRLSGIPIINSVGLQFMKLVESTDLSFAKPRRDPEVGTIVDGSALRPLTDTEQDRIMDALNEYGNRAFQLMIWVALFTGARMQTVCTLRISHILKLLNSCSQDDNELYLNVGYGTDIDVKQQGRYGNRYRLHISVILAKRLIEYADSQEAQVRREKSFYGDTSDNYLFLTRDGTPYYTSKAEIRDRQNPEFSSRIALKDRVKFPIADGKAITNYIHRLITKIRLYHPDFKGFRYHDLRATYGMNFVRSALRNGVAPDEILPMLKSRMGHRNVDTTLIYLNYDDMNERIDKVVELHFDRLNKYI